MRSVSRYWIFFVIIAVGLALSWGQLGRKTNDALRDRQVEFLQTETDCRPLASPCAGMGSGLALVTGPGEGESLLIRVAGGGMDGDLLAVSLLEDGIDAGPVNSSRIDLATWAVAPPPTAPGRDLRVSLQRGNVQHVADFPLR